MEVFWAHGYAGATLEDLQAVMGDISPPSFYHAPMLKNPAKLESRAVEP